MSVGTATLLEAVSLTRQMVQHAEDQDWESLKTLVPRRDAVLLGLEAAPAEREHWEEMHRLNQRVIDLLDAFRTAAIAEQSELRRHAEAAARYLKGGE